MNNNSVLLNGSFFEEEYQKKIDKLNNLEIKTVYVFDHSINPEIKKLPVYKIMDALSKLDKYERNFKIGSMVLNIRKREINELMENYLNPLMEIKNFNLGIFGAHLSYSQMCVLIIYIYTFTKVRKNVRVGPVAPVSSVWVISAT